LGDSVSAELGPVDGPEAAETMGQLVRAAAAAYGDDLAITLTGGGRVDETATFRELDQRSAELARGLLARGVGKGSRIGFIYGNGPGFAVALAAIARIGAIAVPISTLIKANELVRVLRQSDIGGLIVQRRLLGHDYVQRVCDALPGLRTDSPELRLAQAPYLRWIACSGEDLPRSFLTVEALTASAATVSEALLAQVEAEVHPTDQMIEIYTSGSMALPKGVKHSHGPAMFRTQYLIKMGEMARGQSYPAPLPMFWVGGLMMYLLPNWAVGATTLCTEATASSSQMAMGSVLADEDLKAMPRNRTTWGLGMTETLGPYSYGDELRAPGYPLCAPLDHIAENYEVRVADENDQPVSDGATGEIQVRGYALTPGLHKVERADYFTADGYYHTGDMGLVAGKRILFVGRNGDMIKTASSNVSPAEVEMEMQQLAGVHSAYVVGLPDQERGQLVVAAVVPREGVELDFAEVERTLRQRLSSYKVPRAYVAITREEVPVLHSNKVSRRIIEKMMAEKLGRG
jgi:acyl-CoA synthetase (AMP-forming)/AMP-acid ligase II